MSAFDSAMATLLADPNMAIAAEWRAASGGPWRPLRMVLTTAAQEIGAIGARGAALEAVLRTTDLAPDTPRRGDLLRRLSPPETWRIEEAEPDALGLTWRLTLARAP
jgi:hypothetical protein